MNTVTANSRCTMEFELTWRSAAAAHTDSLWTDRVSMWRDCFPQELFAGLLGKGEGGSTTVTLPPGRFRHPYSADRVVRVRPDSFIAPAEGGRMTVPDPGRFYPQRFLRGVAGVFPQSLLPCRFLGSDNGFYRFDLNHPLSSYPLELTAHVREIHPSRVERGGRCEDWLEAVSAGGPGMQARYRDEPTCFCAGGCFARDDEEDDSRFYSRPRLVNHVDAAAERVLTALHGRYVRPGMRVLDLMGSWTSHLPPDLRLQGLTVLGLNGEELAGNGRATETVVRDLNRDPVLPFRDGTYDGVLCSLSVEYLTGPAAVFREVARVLKRGGLLLVSFSNRWFPPKVTRLWKELHEFERIGLVLEFCLESRLFGGLRSFSFRGRPRPEDDPHPEIPLGDPVYLVKAIRG